MRRFLSTLLCECGRVDKLFRDNLEVESSTIRQLYKTDILIIVYKLHTRCKVNQDCHLDNSFCEHERCVCMANFFPSSDALNDETKKWLPAGKPKANGKCQWVCENNSVQPGTNSTTYPDGSWSLDLQVGTDENLHIAYNLTSDFLAIFNPKLNITWITDGIYIGILNMTSDALFLIDTSKDIASIFNGVASNIISGPGELMSFFGRVFDDVIYNSANMVANFAFKVDDFLRALQKHTLEAFFHGHLDMFHLFNLNFGIYINGSIKQDGFNTFLQPILGVGKFSFEIFDFINGGIQYGTKLTYYSIKELFNGLAQISNQIELVIENSVSSIINMGQSTLQAFWNIGGSFFNIISGSIHISGGGSIHISSGKTEDNSWIVNYGNATSGNYSLNYNASQNTIGFYNERLQVALVINGNTGMYGVFNVTTGVGMIVKNDGLANVITNDTQIVIEAFQGSLELKTSFSVIANILIGNANFDMNEENVFDFKGFLAAFFNGTNTTAFFNGKGDLETIVNDNFGEIFTLALENNGAELFDKFGVAVIFNSVFDFNVVGDNFATLFDLIYNKNNGKFTEKFMKKVYSVIQTNISAGSKGFSKFIFAGIVKACIRGSGGLYTGGIFGHLQLGFGNGSC